MRNLEFGNRLVGIAIIVVSSLVVASCGGGGGGGGGGAGAGAGLESIVVQGVQVPIYTNGQAPQPSCAVGAFLNSRIAFTFSGPIDPTSLPADGPAIGAIQVIALGNTTVAATGTWNVDPGNPSVCYFNPLPPSNPSAGCTAGLSSATVYTIFLPDGGGNNQQVVRIGGAPLATAVTTCFSTRVCLLTDPGAALTDPVPGPPSVASTFPLANPSAPLTTVAAISPAGTQSTIIINASEPLQPQTVNPNNILIVNTTANALVPIQAAGLVTFQQTGTVPGLIGQESQITLTTSTLLADGDVYEITTVPGTVLDLGGNPLDIAPGTLLFTTQDNNDGVDQFHFDDFTSITHKGVLTGEVSWNGDGGVRATFPERIVGTGADGAGEFASNMVLNTDLNDGEFNFTSLNVNPGVQLNFSSPANDPAVAVSNYAVQLRAQLGITLDTSSQLIANGRQGDNGQAVSGAQTEWGGHGGPGGGRGGDASPLNTTSSPEGLPGQGGRIQDINNIHIPGSVSNTDTGSDLFGGGGPGISATAGANGPSGGGGGSASHLPSLAGTEGEPQLGAGPPPGQPGPLPPAFVPPISNPIGGSGGGAGGDRLATSAFNNDYTSSAGGGGGGAMRISAGGTISLGQVILLQCNGGNGGANVGPLLPKGAGGSGGSILIQTFGDVVMNIAVQLFCQGGIGSGGNPTVGGFPSGDGGNGGGGLVQLEDNDGMIDTTTTVALAELFTQQFQFTTNVNGTADSRIIDSGSNTTDYVQNNSLGVTHVIASAGLTGTISVQVLGMAEDPNNPGNAGMTPALMMGPVDVANIADLNGFRFFLYRIDTAFPPPPSTILGDALPECTEIGIAWIQ